MIYIFRRRPTQSAGTGNYSFQPNFTLPIVSPIGPAIPVQHLRAVFQAPQVRANISVPTSGIGGLAAGQIFSQRLEK